jgi:hypothetical protein
MPEPESQVYDYQKAKGKSEAQTLSRTLTHFPEAPLLRVTNAEQISDSDWNSLAVDLWNIVTASIAGRSDLEKNLYEWYQMYELEVGEKDTPFEDSSNIDIPIIPSKLDSLLAQTVSKCLVPDFVMVSGGEDPQSQEAAYTIQKYFNDEILKQRGDSSWYKEFQRWIHLGLRDGTSILEVIWRKDVRKEKYSLLEPKTNADGTPKVGPDGSIEYERKEYVREVVRYDDVDIKTIQLKDFLFIPDEAFSVNQAVGVARAVWLYESDLNAMIEDGILNRDWVERALMYVPIGEDDTAADRQGYYEKNAGGQIAVGQGQGTVTSRFFKNRGPIKVWRIHTNQFDMDDDGVSEENIFYLHEISQFMLGWVPEQNIALDRGFFTFTPMPRPDRPYGFSVCERLGAIRAEIDTMHNQRNDEITLRLSPPLLLNKNDDIITKSMQWGPGKRWEVNDVTNAAKPIEMQDVPLASWQEEAQLNSYGDQLIGLSAAQTGGINAGKRTATEVEQSGAGSSLRGDLLAMEFRTSARAALDFIRQLKIQYGTNSETVTPEMLRMPLSIDVAGISDPLDAGTKLQETLAMYGLFKDDPDIAQDAVNRYNLKKMVLQAFRIRDIEAIIGTDKDAAQKKTMEMQQKQEQMQLQRTAILSKAQEETHRKSPPVSGQGPQSQGQQQPTDQQAGMQQQQQPQLNGSVGVPPQ